MGYIIKGQVEAKGSNFKKKGLSCSCYSSTWGDHFIFIVRKCNFFVNNIDKAFTWDVRTLDFMDLALKLSLPQLFP